MAVTDHIDIAVTHTVAGVLETVHRFYGYDEAVMTCVQATATVQAMTEAQVLALSTSAPVAPFRKVWRVTTCSGAAGTDVIANVVLGATEPDETGSGPAPPATLLSASGNPGVFVPAIEWQNGLARVAFATQPALEGGESLFVFIDGHREAIPTPYALRPGDSLSIIVGTAPLPYLYQNGYRQRATTQIVIPTAPTP